MTTTTQRTEFLFRMYDFIQKFRKRISLTYDRKKQALQLKTLSQEDIYWTDRVPNDDLIDTITSMFTTNERFGGHIQYWSERSGEYWPGELFRDADNIVQIIAKFNTNYQQNISFPDYQPLAEKAKYDTHNITVSFNLSELTMDEEKTRDHIVNVLNVFKIN